jgi:hypothetical protein
MTFAQCDGVFSASRKDTLLRMCEKFGFDLRGNTRLKTIENSVSRKKLGLQKDEGRKHTKSRVPKINVHIMNSEHEAVLRV